VNVLVLGSTGVVGDALIRESLKNPRVVTVVAVTRRPLKHTHKQLVTAHLSDFADFSPLEDILARTNVVLCALGISWYQASGEAHYRQITHDYVMACARVAAVANPEMRFCFVSGQGASATSSQAWARIKVETERDLESTFGSRLSVFRPGYIFPMAGREQPYWGDTVMKPLMLARGALSRWITDSNEVARAMLHAALGGAVPSPASNRDMIAAADAYRRGPVTATT
jgi:uncharacterized protein YbjT (DUF2867 family)